MYVYIYVMAKVISISDDVYNLLKSLKRENESFSEVIRRLTKKATISNFSGVLSKEAADEMEKVIEDLNRKIRNEMERF